MDLNASPTKIGIPCSFNAQMAQFQQVFSLAKPDLICEATNGANYTDQVVELLTEQIERRTSWDHQRLLFSVQNDDQRLYEVIQVNLPIELGCQFQHQFIEGEPKQKQYFLQQIKTPDLAPDSDLSNFGNFALQKQKKEIRSQKKAHCNCKKSKCLKMYCECFRNGETCDGCQCCDCGNLEEAIQSRSKARQKIQQKEPAAFLDIFKYKGCRCTKSNCEKGYCECFASGLMCGKYCECKECNNCSNYRKNKQRKEHQNTKSRRGA